MKRIKMAPMIAPNAFNVASEESSSGNSVEFSLAGTTTLSPIVTPIVDSVTTFVTTSVFVTGVLMSVIGGGVGSITGHDEIARPSQAIPVSHSSIVTTAFEPKKS